MQIGFITTTGLFQDEVDFSKILLSSGFPIVKMIPDKEAKNGFSFFLVHKGTGASLYNVLQIDDLSDLTTENPSVVWFYKGSFEGLNLVNPLLFPRSNNPRLFDCSAYYPALGKYLYNSTYIIATKAEVSNFFKSPRKDSAFGKLYDGKEGFFIRSDSSEKVFTGQRVFSSKRLEGLDDDTLLVLSQGKDITGTQEFRFLGDKERIICGSIYLDHSVKSSLHIPQGALDLAEIIRSEYIVKDSVGLWTIDIIAKGDEFRLVEINSFSFADLYYSDMGNVASYFKKKQGQLSEIHD
jgi:hypothetical protein